MPADEGPATSPEKRLPTDFRLERTVLAVADLDRAARWYGDVVGLAPVEAPAAPADDPESGGRNVAGSLRLGAHGHEVLRLVEKPDARRAARDATGLYHHALLLPSRADLAAFVRRLVDARTPVVGASDHGVSEAVYLQDPDGHGVEVYADRPREDWSWRDGRVAMVTEPLDVDDLLRVGDGTDPLAPASTVLGHVHLKVRDAAEAEAFYTERVGLDVVAGFPSATFLSTGGYHHHVGANEWESRGGAPPPEDTTALVAVHASVERPSALAALRARLGEASGDAAGGDTGTMADDTRGDDTRDDGDGTDADGADVVSFRDPSGNVWRIQARGARTRAASGRS